MAILAKNALENPDFAAICGAKTYTAEYGNPPYRRRITNHNKLLSTLDGATGVKTGFTKKAGRCLVSSAEREGVSLICVTLCCPDDWNYHKTLYDEYFKKLKAPPVAENLEAEVSVCGGESVSVSAKASPLSISLFEGEKTKSVFSIPPFVFAPVEKGDILGKVIFYLDGKAMGETPLVAKESVPVLNRKDGILNELFNK